MLSFMKYNPTKLWFGEGQVAQLRNEIGDGKRVLLIYGGGSIKKNGVYDAVLAQLNSINTTVFELSGVEPNPRLSTVHKGIDICNNENIDMLLAVGGGSVIDCTKAIAIGTNYDGDVWDIITKKAVGTSALPFGTVLTLAATASEMNAGSVITNWETNEKIGWGSPFTFPTFSILDPTYTKSVPLDQTVYGIVDTMSHAFEQYFNVGDNTPLTDGFTEALLRTVIETGPKLIENLDDYGLRETMMYSSTLALNGTLSPGVGGGDWASHQIEHAVSAVYDIPHGGGLAIIFPNWMKHTAKTNPTRMKRLAIHVFNVTPEGKTDLEIASEGITALRAFWNSIGAPSTLGDYKVDDSQLDAMVAKACPGETVGYYKPLTKDDVREILIDCM